MLQITTVTKSVAHHFDIVFLYSLYSLWQSSLHGNLKRQPTQLDFAIKRMKYFHSYKHSHSLFRQRLLKKLQVEFIELLFQDFVSILMKECPQFSNFGQCSSAWYIPIHHIQWIFPYRENTKKTITVQLGYIISFQTIIFSNYQN